MHLIAYLRTAPASVYPSGWRHPASVLHDIFRPERYERMARLLEDACFDAAFFADSQGLSDIYKGHFADTIERGQQTSLLDPLMVLPLMARVTSRIGLGTSISTSFGTPYQIARSLASLDHLSGGRAAWNVVTSARDFEFRNHGLQETGEKDGRYDRADDVLEASCALWESWEDGALLLDRNAGRFADASKIRYANHEGPYVRTRGPMSVPRSPQGRPVLLQAGASGRGREFAARWAELIFTSPGSKEGALAYAADMRQRLVAAGRAPADAAILPSISLVVAETDAIAREKAEFIESLVDPELVLAQNSQATGADLSTADLSGGVKQGYPAQGVQGHRERLEQTAKAEGISVSEAVRKPRPLLAGSPATIADHMQDWFESGACDGFVVSPTVDPVTLEDFCRMAVPELQRRGLFRTDYAATTLRGNILDPG